MSELTSVEICAGAGGQALGLAMAGFRHTALVEFEKDYCETLRTNRPNWNVICCDVHDFDGTPYEGVDLLAGGVRHFLSPANSWARMTRETSFPRRYASFGRYAHAL